MKYGEAVFRLNIGQGWQFVGQPPPGDVNSYMRSWFKATRYMSSGGQASPEDVEAKLRASFYAHRRNGSWVVEDREWVWTPREDVGREIDADPDPAARAINCSLFSWRGTWKPLSASWERKDEQHEN